MYVDLPEKNYYKIGEVSKAFNVNASLIRFWEKEFDILQPRKNRKGDRMFSKEDIENLKLIYHLVKEKGFTLEGAKVKLKQEAKQVRENQSIIDRLENIKQELLKIKGGLD